MNYSKNSELKINLLLVNNVNTEFQHSQNNATGLCHVTFEWLSGRGINNMMVVDKTTFSKFIILILYDIILDETTLLF